MSKGIGIIFVAFGRGKRLLERLIRITEAYNETTGNRLALSKLIKYLTWRSLHRRSDKEIIEGLRNFDI